MPSSIKLSVLFGQTEPRLKEIFPDTNVRDMLKGTEFKSKNDSMVIEDLASHVEQYIENVYWNQYGDQYGQLQVQVFRVADQSGAEFGFRDPVSSRLKDGDTVTMDVQTNLETWQQRPQITQEMIEQARQMLRFGLNDRVLCYCGPRWFSGHIVGTAVIDDDDFLPYLVKTDALPGCPARTISVPTDKDHCCTQEVCFDPVQELELVRCAAAMVPAKKPKLRFAVGDKVVCRVKNSPQDGLEHWVPGFISEVWPNIGEASWDMGEISGKFPDTLPYKIEFSSGSGKWVYCHKDDHTLVRRAGMQPFTRVKGISKRMEIIKEADGVSYRVDHVTERRKRMLEEDLSD